MADIKRIIEVIISATNKSGPGVSAASADLEKYGSRLTTVGTIAVTTGAALAGAMAAIVTSTANAEDRIWDLAIQSNSTAETMSTLKYVAEQNGTTIDAVAQSMKFLARNAADAAGGNKEMAQSFKDVGVNVRNANGSLKSSEQLLFEVADGLKGTTSATQATRLSLALLGRGSIELTEFLKLGSAGLREGQAEARKFGAEISTKAAAGADNFNDSLGQLKTSTDGLKRSIGDQLIPTLVPMIKGIAEAAAQAGVWARENPGLAQTIVGVTAVLIGGGGLVLGIGLLTTAAATAAPALAAFWAAALGPAGLIAAAIVAVGLLIERILRANKETIALANLTSGFSGGGAGGSSGGGGGSGAGGDDGSERSGPRDWSISNARAIDIQGHGARGNRDGNRAGPGGGPGFSPADTGVTDPGLTFSLTLMEQMGQRAAESLASIPSLASTAVGGLMTLGDVAGQFVADGFKISADAAAQWAKSLIASIVSIIAKAAILAGILGILGLGGGASFGTLFKSGLGIGVPGHAAGGIIGGGTPGRDSVLGAFMPGEMVIPADFAPGLQRLISGEGGGNRAPIVNQITMPVQYYFGRETDAREAAVKIQRQLDELQRGTRL